MQLDEAEELLNLFRLQTHDIPRVYKTLWLVEEARAKIAVRSLQCRRWNAGVKAFASLFYLHIRLQLLMKAVQHVESARLLANLPPVTNARPIIEANDSGIS